jgi:hypothetical protein
MTSTIQIRMECNHPHKLNILILSRRLVMFATYGGAPADLSTNHVATFQKNNVYAILACPRYLLSIHRQRASC